MVVKMKRKEKECFNYAQRWNKRWDNYCLVVSSFFAGYEAAKEFCLYEGSDTGNELVEVDVGMHQLEQNYRRGLLDYESIIRGFFKDFNSEDIRIHRSEDGVIIIQASFKVMDGKS
jgi:hypothetical protein